jgi:hypothetical protein
MNGQTDPWMQCISKSFQVKVIWNHLGIWWKAFSGQDIELSKKYIIVGLEARNIKLKMKNQLDTIILVAKWRIYVNKQLGQKTSFIQIKRDTEQMINTL